MILLMQKLLVLFLASTAIDLAFPDTFFTPSLPDVHEFDYGLSALDKILDKLTFMEYNTEP